MITAILHRQRNSVARSMSGALRQSRLSDQPRYADMIHWASKGRLLKAANLNRIGERSCVISWLPLRLADYRWTPPNRRLHRFGPVPALGRAAWIG